MTMTEVMIEQKIGQTRQHCSIDVVTQVCFMMLIFCVYLFIIWRQRSDQRLIPLIFYFMMFSAICFSWIAVASSMKCNAYEMMKNVKVALIIANIIYLCLLLIQIILLLMKFSNKYIYLVFEIIWCGLILISTLSFSYYGYKMVKLIFKTAKMMRLMHSNTPSRSTKKEGSTTTTNTKHITPQRHSNIGDEAKIAKKLSFIAIVIILFFCIQFILTVYFISGLNINKVTLMWRIIDISSHLLCLIIICFMYHKTIEKLRRELNIEPLCGCINININISFKSNNNNTMQRIQSHTAGSVLDSNSRSDQSTNNTLNQTDLIQYTNCYKSTTTQSHTFNK